MNRPDDQTVGCIHRLIIEPDLTSRLGAPAAILAEVCGAYPPLQGDAGEFLPLFQLNASRVKKGSFQVMPCCGDAVALSMPTTGPSDLLMSRPICSLPALPASISRVTLQDRMRAVSDSRVNAVSGVWS